MPLDSARPAATHNSDDNGTAKPSPLTDDASPVIRIRQRQRPLNRLKSPGVPSVIGRSSRSICPQDYPSPQRMITTALLARQQKRQRQHSQKDTEVF
jgi:hypothetical protein